MNQSTTFSGGCLCGDVRYEISEAPQQAGHCHCENCRRHTGAAFATDAVFSAKATKWLGAAPVYYNSSAECARGFCGKCGSTVSCLYSGKPDLVIIAAGTLDNPNLITPAHHGYASRRLEWATFEDGLPAYATDIPGYEPENRGIQ